MNGRKAKMFRSAVSHHPSNPRGYMDTNIKNKKLKLVSGLNMDGTEQVREIPYRTSTKVLTNCSRAAYQGLKRKAA